MIVPLGLFTYISGGHYIIRSVHNLQFHIRKCNILALKQSNVPQGLPLHLSGHTMLITENNLARFSCIFLFK